MPSFELNDGWMALVVAGLLGLRHATDPDHLTAVSTLVLSDLRYGTRRATLLGLSWGLGHAVSLSILGIPAVLFRRFLPDSIQRGLEMIIGLMIVVLAVRLLIRWRRGYFHSHPHGHGLIRHSHPHRHEDPGHAHSETHVHLHAEALGRSPLAAFGIGLVHGAGGTAAAGILIVGATPESTMGVLALLLFAASTAASMALVSSAFGYALLHGPAARRLTALVPVLGVASLVFGAWYAFGALAWPRAL